jgi:hypothetical protein
LRDLDPKKIIAIIYSKELTKKLNLLYAAVAIESTITTTISFHIRDASIANLSTVVIADFLTCQINS